MINGRHLRIDPAITDAGGRGYPRVIRTVTEGAPDLALCAPAMCEEDGPDGPAEVQLLLDEVFDQAIVHHGFVDYMRDYEIVVYCTANPRTGVAPEHVRLLFKNCVAAEAETAVPPDVWRRSLDERLISYGPGVDDLGGYVWASSGK